VHALDKRDHPLEPNEGAGELQLISPDRDLRIGGGQGLKAAAEQGCLVFCAEGARAFKENECKWPMWRTCKMAGLRRISWHVLRHPFEGGRQSRPRSYSRLRQAWVDQGQKSRRSLDRHDAYANRCVAPLDEGVRWRAGATSRPPESPPSRSAASPSLRPNGRAVRVLRRFVRTELAPFLRFSPHRRTSGCRQRTSSGCLHCGSAAQGYCRTPAARASARRGS